MVQPQLKWGFWSRSTPFTYEICLNTGYLNEVYKNVGSFYRSAISFMILKHLKMNGYIFTKGIGANFQSVCVVCVCVCVVVLRPR